MFEQNRYKETFSQITASDATKDKILCMQRKESRKGVKVAKLVLVGTMLLTMVACAALFDAGAMIETAFGENGRKHYDYEEFTYKTPDGDTVTELQWAGERNTLDAKLAEELLEPYVFEVGKSVAYDTCTLTVLACLHDPVTMSGVAYLCMENPGGFSDIHIWENGRISWRHDEGDSRWRILSEPYGVCYIDDALTTETKLYFTCQYVCINAEQEMRVYFTETEEGVTFAFPERTQMRHLSFAEGDIILSPITFACDQTRFDVANKPTIQIRYKDGEEKYIVCYEVNKGGACNRKQPVENYVLAPQLTNDRRENKTYLLSFLVDLDEVHSVVINGEEFFSE